MAVENDALPLLNKIQTILIKGGIHMYFDSLDGGYVGITLADAVYFTDNSKAARLVMKVAGRTFEDAVFSGIRHILEYDLFKELYPMPYEEISYIWEHTFLMRDYIESFDSYEDEEEF